MRMSKNGLVVDGDGWFVVNARAARWKDEGPLGLVLHVRRETAVPAVRDQHQRPRAW